ncbi:MAG TPA: tRNA pseudouridine(38-40) synthase TruA [Candidatus Omnitrophota bacterium]|nr:tRNA pseudouridine(38-40) synthase TruA [Candidatus Omnitrophota bacterium]
MVRNIKLVLEYDGSTFFGFQRQPSQPTVQEALEKALSSFFDRKIKIAAASGRTDTGVHAEGQVVNFKTTSGRNIRQIQKGLNALLPAPVVVKEIKEVPLDFHARYNVKSKVYEYRIWNHPCRSPLLAKRVFHVPYSLNVAWMRQAAKYFLGKRDFRSFTSISAMKKERSCVRTIRQFRIKKQGHLLIFHVEADGFLYHMIRNMVGTLMEVGRSKRKPEEIKAILQSKDRRLAGMTAPSKGLTLLRVTY